MANISFIIPTFNNFQKTKYCLISIFKNLKKNKKNFEIVIIDDGSGTAEFKKLKNYVESIKERNVCLLRIRKNKGPAYARNLGAKKAKFKYLFFLDSDTEINKKTVFYFLKQIKKHDAVVGIYNYKPLNKGLFSNHKALFNYFYFMKSGVKKYETFHSACAGIKKAIFLKIGGFDPKIKWGMDYENEDLGRRIIKKYSMILDPKMQVFHNFPDALTMSSLYFKRVKSWIYNFFQDKKFESTGTATIKMAIGSLVSLLLFFNFIFFLFTSYKYVEILFIINFIIYTLFYFDFFYFVFKKNASYLLSSFIINIYVNLIVIFSALVAFSNKLFIFPFANIGKS